MTLCTSLKRQAKNIYNIGKKNIYTTIIYNKGIGEGSNTECTTVEGELSDGKRKVGYYLLFWPPERCVFRAVLNEPSELHFLRHGVRLFQTWVAVL